MHRRPAIVSITPDVLGQSDGHRGDAWPALLAHTLMRQHNVVEVDHQPHPRLVPALTRGTAAGAPAPGSAHAPQGSLPARHERRVERGPQSPTSHLRHEAAGAAIDHARDDVQALDRAIAPLHHLAGAQVAGGSKRGFR
jgi:hypothetical protein